MPVTLSDDQVKAVEVASGLKWPAVRSAMGIPPPERPVEVIQPVTAHSTYRPKKEDLPKSPG